MGEKMQQYFNTVLGNIAENDVGVVLSHEHICCYSEYLYKMSGGKFPDIEPLGVSKRHLKVKMNHEGFSAEHKLKILKRCFEGTENIRDVAIDEKVSRTIIYSWRKRYLKYGVFGLQQKKKQIKRTASIEELKADHSTDKGEIYPLL